MSIDWIGAERSCGQHSAQISRCPSFKGFVCIHKLAHPADPFHHIQFKRDTRRLSFLSEIIQELGGGLDARNTQGIPRPCARNVQELPFRLIYLLQVSVVSNRSEEHTSELQSHLN